MAALTIADFAGTWTLSRRIDDRHAGQVAHATGQAVLCDDGAGLVYDERIRLVLPGAAPIDGHRRYLWRAVPGGITVQFADGRAFHGFALDGPGAEAAHWCDPDQYDVRYDFASWPVWRSLWTVKGPRKDYAMATEYAPAGAV